MAETAGKLVSHASGLRPEPEEAVEILYECMSRHPKDEKLQVKALLSLIRMSAKDEEREIVGQSECLITALNAIRTFPEKEEIVSKGCMLLANIAFESEANKRRICKHHGVELVTQIIHRGSDENVLCWALLALRNLTSQSKDNQIEANACDAPHALRRVLNKFRWNKKIVIHGIAALGNIADGGLDCQMRIRESGSIEAVTELMWRYTSCSSVVEHFAVAIKEICKKNEKNQTKFANLAGVALLAEGLKLRTHNKELIVKLCETVRYVCFDEKARIAVGNTGMLNTILDILDEVSASCGAEGVDTALKALSNAACDVEDNKRMLTRCGGIEKVMKVVRCHSEHIGVVGSSLRLFRNLIDDDGVNTQLLRASKVFIFSVTCMERLAADEEITEHSFGLLLSAASPRYKYEDIEKSPSELLGIVKEKMGAFSSSIEVQKLGITLLSSLESTLEESREQPVLQKNRTKDLLGKIRRTVSGAL